MNINLHLLNASGSLNNFTKAINDSFSVSVKAISKFLNISDIDVVVYDDPIGALPEFGMGGYTPNAHIIFVSIDPKFTPLQSSFEDEFKKTLAHEFHHAMRWRDPGLEAPFLKL